MFRFPGREIACKDALRRRTVFPRHVASRRGVRRRPRLGPRATRRSPKPPSPLGRAAGKRKRTISGQLRPRPVPQSDSDDVDTHRTAEAANDVRVQPLGRFSQRDSHRVAKAFLGSGRATASHRTPSTAEATSVPRPTSPGASGRGRDDLTPDTGSPQDGVTHRRTRPSRSGALAHADPRALRAESQPCAPDDLNQGVFPGRICPARSSFWYERSRG